MKQVKLVLDGVSTVTLVLLFDSLGVDILITVVKLGKVLTLSSDIGVREIFDYIYKDERDSINFDYRFYMVGHLTRQDRGNPDPGYREVLSCKLCDKPMQVIGPYHYENTKRYMARCINDKCKASRYRYYARTVIDLWDILNPKPAQQVE